MIAMKGSAALKGRLKTLRWRASRFVFELTVGRKTNDFRVIRPFHNETGPDMPACGNPFWHLPLIVGGSRAIQKQSACSDPGQKKKRATPLLGGGPCFMLTAGVTWRPPAAWCSG